MSRQLIRSCTSPALNYAEAQAAESKEDFIHKLKIYLKELKETNVSLRIIQNKNIAINKHLNNQMIAESWELIAIFISSIETAVKNLLIAQLAETKNRLEMKNKIH